MLRILWNEKREGQHTQPVVQLLNPRRPGVLYRRVQKDNLILYPDFMHNRFQRHMTFQELRLFDQIKTQKQRGLPDRNKTDLFFLCSFVASSLIRQVPNRWQISPCITIIRSTKLGAPYLDDLGQPLQENSFDALVKFCHPIIQVCVTFQVKSINLPKENPNVRTVTRKRQHKVTHSTLNLVQQFRKGFRCIRTGCKILNCTQDILVQIYDVVRFVLDLAWLTLQRNTRERDSTNLQHRDHAGEFSNELNVSIIPSVRSSNVPRCLVLVDEVIPTNVHS